MSRVPTDTRSTRSVNLKSNAMSPRMRAQTRWEGSEKQLKICKLKHGFQKIFFLTCKICSRHHGQDMDACADMNPGKYLEKEPVLCHRVDQKRHFEHSTIESGREDGSM